MKPKQLILKCLAKEQDGQWVAICLDFDLVAQADSLPEAKLLLEDQIKEYVFDALAGEDQAYADQLLSRRSPWQLWAAYYLAGFLQKVLHIRNGLRFNERMPLVPDNHRFA